MTSDVWLPRSQLRRSAVPTADGALASRACSRWIATAFFALAILAVDPSASPAQEAAQTMAVRYSAIQAMREAVARLRSLDPAPFIEAARNEMRAQPGQHVTEAASKAIVQAGLGPSIDARVEASLVSIAKAMKLEERNVPEASFRADAMSALKPTIDELRADFIRRNADRVFTDARKVVVEEQRALLLSSAFPSVDAVQTLDREGWSAERLAALQAGIEAQVKRQVPVPYEETSKAARDIAGTTLRTIQAQRDRQLVNARQPIAASHITRGQIEAALLSSVEQALVAAKATEPASTTVYPVLPSVRDEIKSRAVEEENRRWMENLDQQKVDFSLPSLRSAITANVADHRTAAASETLFALEARARAGREAVQRRVTQAEGAPDRTEYQARIESSLTADGPARSALDKSIRSSLSAPLAEARRAVANDQYARFFPGYADRSWQPDGFLIAEAERGNAVLGSYAQAADVARNSAVGSPPPRDQLIAETEVEALNGAKRVLEEGQRAWRAQSRIIDRLAPAITAEISKVTELDKSGLDGWVTQFATRAESDWEQERAGLWSDPSTRPPNASRKYRDLFNPMRDRVGDLVRRAFEVHARKLAEDKLRRETQPPPQPVTAVSQTQATTQGAASGDKIGPGRGPGDGGNGGGGGGGGSGAPADRCSGITPGQLSALETRNRELEAQLAEVRRQLSQAGGSTGPRR